MTKFNVVSPTLSEEDFTANMDSFQAIRNVLKPIAVQLTQRERITYAKMGDKSLAFVEKALYYAKQRPEITPPFLDVDGFEDDFNGNRQLMLQAREGKEIVRMAEDTAMLAGSEAFDAALTFYHAVKLAAKKNVPGAYEIFRELKKRYPNHPTITNTDGEEEDNPSADNDSSGDGLDTANP